MTTMVLTLTPSMAKRVAKATDVLEMATHEDLGLTAVGLFLDSILGSAKGRKPQSLKALQDARRKRRAR